MSVSKAIKFRDHLLRDLQRTNCLLVTKKDRTYAEEIAERVKGAIAFFIDPDGVSFLEEGSNKLGEQEFYESLSNLRLPFNSVWVELDASTKDGQHKGRVGAIVDCIEDGLRVLPADLFKLPEERSTTVVYSGSEVVFRRDGKVELADTPVAEHQDFFDEIKRGRPRQSISQQAQPDTVKERENDALRKSIQIVGLLLAISGVYERPEVIDIKKDEPLEKSGAKRYEKRGEIAPKFALTVVRLSKLGRKRKAEKAVSGGEDSGQKRAAHWVTGHYFLAKNGKLTWRRPHTRGEGEVAGRPRRYTE